MIKRVLVTDGDQRASLACVRALGRAGDHCYVLGPRRGSLAGASRYCRESAESPDPLRQPEAFVDAVLERVEAWGIDVLLPITEKSLRAILPRRDLFEGVEIPFPSASVFERVSDKSEVLRTARKIGISVPRQWEMTDREPGSIPDIPRNSFPLVVKPTRSVVAGRTGSRQTGVGYLRDPAGLLEWFASVSADDFPVLLQEKIEGHGAGVFLLLWEGKLRAVVGHRRVREKPPSGGVSVVRDTTAVDPDLLEKSLGLLAELGFTDGVAMVEYKVGRDTGVPFLMEINGRFWGSLQLAVDGGVDFPCLLRRCSAGDPPAEPVVGVPGARTRWLMGDVDQLLLRLFRSRERLDLPPDHPGKVRALRDFFIDFRPGVRLEVLRLSDPYPFLKESSAWVRGLFS